MDRRQHRGGQEMSTISMESLVRVAFGVVCGMALGIFLIVATIIA
jgi:hypothetical protein